jgi:cysteine desulfurase family protein
MPDRIYLDNAATTWPKPAAVYDAVDHYLRHNGAAAGRGVYRDAVDADRLVESARAKVAKLIHAPDPSRVVFTLNATDALNLALHGIVQPGDRVVTSDVEHNSVLRPLQALSTSDDAQIARIACDETGRIDMSRLREALREKPRLVAVTHASNVTGVIQPIDEIVAAAHEAGARVLVDAAQSAGHLPIDVQALGVDLLAASGHKGLLGLLGTGFLYIAPGLEAELQSLRQGGTGTRSDEDVQPTTMPDRYESGNANVPGLAGMAAGVDYLMKEGVEAIHEREFALVQRLMHGLDNLPGVRMVGPPIGAPRVGLLAITVDGYDPRELAALLDANFGIQVRAGLHCAPRIHKQLGAWPTGTGRFSIGPFNTEEHIDAAIAAVREAASG